MSLSSGFGPSRSFRNCISAGYPILVIGGTGFYLRVLQRGIFACPKPKPRSGNDGSKPPLIKVPNSCGTTLKEADPKAADRIHPRDTFRLIRALEVLELTGRPISDWQQWGQETESEFDILWIGLSLEREALYRKINLRTEEMMTKGFLAEVQGLLEKGYSPELKPMQSLGYRHLTKVLKGELGFGRGP